MSEANEPMSDSADAATAAMEDFPSATAGPGGFLRATADKNDHEMSEAEQALESHQEPLDVESALEDFPSATAGPGQILALTADHPNHKAH